MQKQNLENKMDPKLPSIELQLKDLKKKISKESLGGKIVQDIGVIFVTFHFQLQNY